MRRMRFRQWNGPMLFDRLAWIVHDGRSGLSFSRNDQIPRTPFEAGLGVAAFLGEVEVVVSGRDLAKKIMELPPAKWPVSSAAFSACRDRPSPRLRSPRQASESEMSAGGLRVRRTGESEVPVADADKEEPLANLRHAVVCCVHDPPHAVVARPWRLARNKLQSLAMNLVGEAQRRSRGGRREAEGARARRGTR